MLEKESKNRGQASQSSPKRRSVLRGLSTGIASIVALGGTALAEQTSGSKRTPTEVESVDFEMDSALQKLDNVIDSPLFGSLVSKGLLPAQSIDVFPSHRLADDSQPGGVDWLLVNGELEQLNFHKIVDGKRLEVNLPLSDNEPKAVLHEEGSNPTVYHYGNRFQGEKLDVVSTSGNVGTSDHCSGYRWCTTCWACCGYDNWSRDEEQVDCPNCVVGHCQWVKIGCCDYS